MKNRLTVLLLAAVLLASCAGTPFKWNSARKISPGMTVAEVTELIGPPTRVQSNLTELIYIWVYVNTLNGTTRSLRVDFDRSGKVIAAPVVPDTFQD